MFRVIRKFDLLIESFAKYALVFCVFGMLSISVLSIVLRWFEFTFQWFEPLVRHLVFISAFLGGVMATGNKTHIGIDIIGKYLESKGNEKALIWIERVVSLASAVTLIWLTSACIQFVGVEAIYGKEVFLGIHSKFLVGIIPVGFSLISLRFFNLLICSFDRD